MQRLNRLLEIENFFQDEPEDYLDQNLFTNAHWQMNFAQYLLIQGKEKTLLTKLPSTTKIDSYENTIDHYLAILAKPYTPTDRSNIFGQFPQDMQELVSFQMRLWNDLTPQISVEDWLLCMLMPQDVSPSALQILDEWFAVADTAPFEIQVYKDRNRRQAGGYLMSKKRFLAGDLVGLHLGRFL